jgi:hypothetical protein
MSAVKALAGVGRMESESSELDWEAVGRRARTSWYDVTDINRRGLRILTTM